jgi:DNA-binding CsgD family transcriptional regulator
MAHLARQDLDAGLRLIRDLSTDIADPLHFAHRGVAALPKLVDAEITTLSVCDLAAATRGVVSNPESAISAADQACFNHFFAQHPLVRYHAAHPNGGSRRISDSFPAQQFRRTALYNEYYRRIGIDHVIAVPLFVDRKLLVSFVLNRRGRDFSERDRAVLDLVRGYLANLYGNALAMQRADATMHALRNWSTAEGWASASIAADGSLGDCSDRAAALLACYCPGWAATTHGALPSAVGDWLRSASSVSFAGLAPLRLERGGNALRICAFADPAQPERCFLLMQERITRRDAEHFARLPATPRERQVLVWLSAGKTDREIAEILGVSVRTVQKHLERLYGKLGVETRTAAVMRALAMVDERSE